MLPFQAVGAVGLITTLAKYYSSLGVDLISDSDSKFAVSEDHEDQRRERMKLRHPGSC